MSMPRMSSRMKRHAPVEIDDVVSDSGTDEYDDRRTVYLCRRGLHMLRIPNEQLIRDSEIVVEMIQAAIDQCLRSRENGPPHPPSAPCTNGDIVDTNRRHRGRF
jgi:hypothetical protein